jgi:hypothetical protein
VTLVATQVVPYPRLLDDPPVAGEFNENRLRAIAIKCGVDTSIQIYLCRDRMEAILSVVQPGSIAVLRGRRSKWLPRWLSRWWISKDERLARRLRQRGCEVMFREAE